MLTIFSDLYPFVFRYTHLIVNKYYIVVNQDISLKRIIESCHMSIGALYS